jgi:hypothetical protein
MFKIDNKAIIFNSKVCKSKIKPSKNKSSPYLANVISRVLTILYKAMKTKKTQKA